MHSELGPVRSAELSPARTACRVTPLISVNSLHGHRNTVKQDSRHHPFHVCIHIDLLSILFQLCDISISFHNNWIYVQSYCVQTGIFVCHDLLCVNVRVYAGGVGGWQQQSRIWCSVFGCNAAFTILPLFNIWMSCHRHHGNCGASPDTRTWSHELGDAREEDAAEKPKCLDD